MLLFFFFSSRRRHTRCLSDWSSDVCSSDLRSRRAAETGSVVRNDRIGEGGVRALFTGDRRSRGSEHRAQGQARSGERRPARRSEERRVGKEGRWRWVPGQNKKNKQQVEDKD